MPNSQVFPNPEDCSSPGLYRGGTVTFADADVERVRRAHRNDLENIGLFLAVTHFYLATDPPVALAKNLIRAFACLRFTHTLVYLNKVRFCCQYKCPKGVRVPFGSIRKALVP